MASPKEREGKEARKGKRGHSTVPRGRKAKGEGKPPSKWFEENLRLIREQKHLSQKDVADRLTEWDSPIHQTAIAKVEAGERKVTVDDAFRLAAALDVSPLVLLLPRDDNERVAICPRIKPPAGDVREWIAGLNLMTVASHTHKEVAGGPSYFLTLDGKEIDDRERAEREWFYRSSMSERQYRAHSHPGVRHLLGAANGYARAIGDGNRQAMRRQLRLLKQEVERQEALLDESEG